MVIRWMRCSRYAGVSSSGDSRRSPRSIFATVSRSRSLTGSLRSARIPRGSRRGPGLQPVARAEARDLLADQPLGDHRNHLARALANDLKNGVVQLLTARAGDGGT